MCEHTYVCGCRHPRHPYTYSRHLPTLNTYRRRKVESLNYSLIFSSVCVWLDPLVSNILPSFSAETSGGTRSPASSAGHFRCQRWKTLTSARTSSVTLPRTPSAYSQTCKSCISTRTCLPLFNQGGCVRLEGCSGCTSAKTTSPTSPSRCLIRSQA
jgi:hypothetical protein